MTIHDEQVDRVERKIEELWVTCIIADVGRLAAALDADAEAEALEVACRILSATRRAREQNRVLARIAHHGSEPADLNTGQYAAVITGAAAAWRTLESLMARRGITASAIYARTAVQPELLQLFEVLVNWDIALQALLVERFVRTGDRRLAKCAADLLRDLTRRFRMPLFPDLWKARSGKRPQLVASVE